MFPSAANPFTARTALSVLEKYLNQGKGSLGEERVTHNRKTLGAYRVWILYPSLCLVSPAMTEKSAPAIAKMVPPFSVYGLNCRCWGRAIEMISGMLFEREGARVSREAMVNDGEEMDDESESQKSESVVAEMAA